MKIIDGYLTYNDDDYLKHIKEALKSKDQTERTIATVSLLLMTLIRLDVYKLREADGEELGDRIEDYAERRTNDETIKKQILDGYCRSVCY